LATSITEKIGSHFCRDKQAKKGLEGEKPDSLELWLRTNNVFHKKSKKMLKLAKFRPLKAILTFSIFTYFSLCAGRRIV
jgi:hypothetical protein